MTFLFSDDDAHKSATPPEVWSACRDIVQLLRAADPVDDDEDEEDDDGDDDHWALEHKVQEIIMRHLRPSVH